MQFSASSSVPSNQGEGQMAASAKPSKKIHVEYDLSIDGLIETVNDAVAIHVNLKSMLGFRFAGNESEKFSQFVFHAKNQLEIAGNGSKVDPNDLRKTITLGQSVRDMLENHFEEFVAKSPLHFDNVVSWIRKKDQGILTREADTIASLQQTFRDLVDSESSDIDHADVAVAYNALSNHLAALEKEISTKLAETRLADEKARRDAKEAERLARRKKKVGNTLEMLNSLSV